jgi:nicotinamide riboside kinase
MKIACTGTSSTGKTTLATRAPSEPDFAKYALRYIGTDARMLLKERGLRNVDEMSKEQGVDFQLAYFERKLSLEDPHESYITDRSFVDVAAYWIEYTGLPDDKFVSRCRDESRRYDIHIYFPPDLIRFEGDGYRSFDMDVHRRIDASIVTLLKDWEIHPVVVQKIDLEGRLFELLTHLETIYA